MTASFQAGCWPKHWEQFQHEEMGSAAKPSEHQLPPKDSKHKTIIIAAAVETTHYVKAP